MPVNPDTGIDYDNDRFAKVRLSDGEILNKNMKWIRADGGPIQEGTGDYAYYKRVPAEPINADHRFSEDSKWAIVDADPLPAEGYPRGEYKQTITAVKLPKEDLKRQVEDHFQTLVQLWFPTAHDPAVLVEAAGAIIRKGNNAALTDAQQATLTNIVGIEDAIRQNRARQEALFAAIEAEEDYDIEEGWIAPEA